MTRIDTAALHADLTRQITEARRYHTMATTDQLPDLVDLYNQKTTALVAADGWLRHQAFDHGHKPGHTIHIQSLIEQLRLDLDEWLEYLDGEADRQHRHEHRVKTLRRLANEAPWFCVPDPFPEPGPGPVRRGGWLRRLVGT